MEKKNVNEISGAVTDAYKNFELTSVNDHCVRMSVMEGEYPWHFHQDSEELFFLLEGQLRIEFQDQKAIVLLPGDYLKIPAKMIHKTSAIGRSVNLCFETSTNETVFV